MKKSKFIVAIAFLIVMIGTIVNASELKVIDSNSDYRIENENIKFTKKIISCDKNNKEVEIELFIENTKSDEEEKDNTEIILILDNSVSMEKMQSNETRKNLTYEAASRLINSMYDNFKGVEVGIMQYDTKNDILTELTYSKTEALAALEKYKKSKCGDYTQTANALKLAKTKFSKECKNKILILVTDGYPTAAVDTRNELLAIEQTDIKILSAIICEDTSNIKIQDVFGTEQNPTAGKIYYIPSDSKIDSVLNELLYSEIVNYIKYPIKNVEIKDFFPEHIIKYFDITYTNIPSKGVATSINGNYFTWTINSLEGKEKASFRYKLKLKNDIDITPIINKNLKTNETVTVNYENSSNIKINEIIEKQPVIKIEEIENVVGPVVEENKPTENKPIENEQEVKVETEVKTETEQEFVIVDITQEEQEKEETKKVQQTTKPSQSVNSIKEEKLPQTGDEEIIILIAVTISIILAIKMKLTTKDIYIVKKQK